MIRTDVQRERIRREEEQPMTNRYRLPILATLVCMLCIDVSLSQAMATLSGLVTDAKTNGVLPGVQITIEVLGGGAIKTISTDSVGRFVADGLPPGSYKVVPKYGGYLFWRKNRRLPPEETGPTIEVRPGEVRTVALSMSPEATIAGTVLDSRGQPIVATTISVLRDTYSATGKRELRETLGRLRTDDRGRFRFSGLYPSDYYLRITGGPFLTRPMTYFPGTSDITKAIPLRVNMGDNVEVGTVVVPRQTLVQGRLRFREMGEPARIRDLYLAPDTVMARRLSDDGLGQMQVSISEGIHDLLLSWVSNSELIFGQFTLTVANSGFDEEVHVRRGIRVRGTVSSIDATGRRAIIPSARCLLHSEIARPYLQVNSTNCIDQWKVPGPYRLELQGLPQDAYVVEVVTGGQSISEGTLEVSNDLDFSVTVAPLGGSVTGTVKDRNGEPLAGARVALVPASNQALRAFHYRTAFTLESGTFELRGIAPGAYQLFAWTEVEGSAFRDPEFLQPFANRGKAIEMTLRTKITTDITAID